MNNTVYELINEVKGNNININKEKEIEVLMDLYRIYNDVLCVQATDKYALSVCNNTRNNLKRLLNSLGVEV